MPSPSLLSTLYKGLFMLTIVFIVLEYFFGTISESRPWVAIFANNSSREPFRYKGIQDLHSPVFRSLFGKKSAEGTLSVNATKVSPITDLPTIILQEIPQMRNTTDNEGNSSCSDIKTHLLGRVKIRKSPVPTIQELEDRFSWLQPGGHWSPDFCTPQKKIAIVVPFRWRGEHLLLFLQHIHPFLKLQQLDYTIFVVEQDGNGDFNRGLLMNIGFVEAMKLANFDCFIFHDVDLLPEDYRNLYSCPVQPRHMSVAVDSFKYRLPYPGLFGGVSALTTAHFRLVNGFSNSFWGWGGEDDDMSNRIRYHNLHISRYPVKIARYTMLDHPKGKPNPSRHEVLKSGRARYSVDGLNSLKYTLKELKFTKLYTWLLVQVVPVS